MSARSVVAGFVVTMALLYVLRVDLLPAYQEMRLRNTQWLSQNYGVRF